MPSPKNAGSVTEEIAAYSLATDFSKLPSDVIDRTKRIIADEISCMVMGSAMEVGEVIRAYVASLGGVAESTIIGGGVSAPSPFAALVNGTCAHGDEMDGTHISVGHPGGSSLAGTLAIVESRSLAGPDLINAVALSYNVGTRAMLAMGNGPAIMREHNVYGAVLYTLGVAAACGRLLHLQQLQVQHAMALAMMNVTIPGSFHAERKHMSKSLNQGQIAFAGITGALLASYGFEAHDTVIEAKHGIIDGWKTSAADLDLLTSGLGTEFMVMQAGFKYYSAGYPIHSPLRGALALMADNALSPDDVAAVRVGMPTASADVVDNRAMASISIQAMLALGMVLGQLTHADAENESNLDRPDVQRLGGVIEIVRDETMTADDQRRRVSWVEIATNDGRVFRGARQIPPGHWEEGGMPWEDLQKKFESLVVPVLGPEATKSIWSIVTTLDEQEDVQALTQLLRRARM